MFEVNARFPVSLCPFPSMTGEINVCGTGHIKDAVLLFKKSRASCPGGRPILSFHSSSNPHHRTE